MGAKATARRSDRATARNRRRAKAPPPISLPPLEWNTSFRGKVTNHAMPNPIEGIVNKFNRFYAKYGMVAAAGKAVAP